MGRRLLLLCFFGLHAACAQTNASKEALSAKLRYDRPARNAAEQREREEAIFQHYSVALTDLKSFAHVKPRLDTPEKRMFRTRLRQAAATSPGFADTVSVQRFGCGSGCFVHAMVDVRTGTSYLSQGVSGFEGQRSDFRRNSRALHVLGLINEEKPGDRWYVWTGKQLELVYYKPLDQTCFAGSDLQDDHIAQTARCDYLPDETP